jgi:endonuclease/exonuclease/phosphatase family metal-dependent hydrolase
MKQLTQKPFLPQSARSHRLLLAIVVAACGWSLSDSVFSESATVAANSDISECNSQPAEDEITSSTLSVMTLNLAHGRKAAINQMLQKTSTTRLNLEQISAFLDDSGADLIALQEADSSSRWSGKFNHVNFISDNSNYPCRVHGHHAQKYMYDFGTALLSPVGFTDGLSHTFTPSPPTTDKGFVMGKVRWNPGGLLSEAITVSVISVHLDFSRKKVRESQVQEIRDILPDIDPPLIILGDFNTDWTSDGSALKTIATNGNLKAYQPEAINLGTYKNGKHRLDWILISDDLEFVSYEVPQEVLSDHQPVLASVRLLENSEQKPDSSRHD